MKASRSQQTKQSHQGYTNKPVPEIRDNLDDRHNEEFQTKSDMKKSKRRKKDKSEMPKRS